jgi:RNAse (barnase) inhibitor barstar
VPKRFTVEDVLSDELKREMNLDTDTFAVLDDWDSVMNSVYQLPIEYAGYTNRVSDMKLLREMVDTLEAADFDHVKRSESRKKQLAQFKKTLSMYYNVIFTKGKKKVGYGALIHFPKLKSDPDRSGGIVLAARITVEGGGHKVTFERGKFDDFLVEVKPYINLLGDLYRQTRKM